MDIRNLINLLPPIFKMQDTYKVGGKGFLERYLEICGSYLTDVITSDIDNILDLIDIDHTPKEYLNNLWEFLGEIPFANIFNVDREKWDLLRDDPKANESMWLLPNNKPIVLTEQTARDLIKYSLSLYKIRGTKRFFEVILRLYGLECLIQVDEPSYIREIPHLDTNVLDTDSTDIDYSCSKCTTVTINLDDRKHELVFASKDGEIFMGSDGSIFTGKSMYIEPNFDNGDGTPEFFDLKELVTEYNEYPGTINFNDLTTLSPGVRMFVILRRAFEAFFDRFLPYNAKATFKYDGIVPDDKNTFNVLYEDPDNSFITKENPTVNLLVTPSSKWPDFDKRYMVAANDSITDWDGEYKSDTIYTVTRPGTYYFKSMVSDRVVPVTVGIKSDPQVWSLVITDGNIRYLSILGGYAIIQPVAKFGTQPVGITLIAPDGTTNTFSSGTNLEVSDPGEYRVYITDNPSVYTTVYVYDKPMNTVKTMVDIPYGIEVTMEYDSSGTTATQTVGGPNSESPAILVYSKSQNPKITNIRPWLRDPKDPDHILYGTEFVNDNAGDIITTPSYYSAISVAKRSDSSYGDDPDLYKRYSRPGGLSTSKTKSLLNAWMNSDGHTYNKVSWLLAIADQNLSNYYDPMGKVVVNGVEQSFYLNNPVMINVVSELSTGSIGSELAKDGSELKLTNNSDQAQDITVIGAIMTSGNSILDIPVWPGSNVNFSEGSSWVATTNLAANGSTTLDISDIKFKWSTDGNTISRNLLAIGRSDYGLANIKNIYIQDTLSVKDGLYLRYSGNNWGVGTVEGGFNITLNDGTTRWVSRIYTCALNNSNPEASIAKFGFDLIIGGIKYKDTSYGDIIVGDDGSTYNLRSTYFKDKVRYWMPYASQYSGGYGYIFSVNTANPEDPEYNIMLNIVIDKNAEDRGDITFDMVPQVFYLPSNGKKAITSMLASRPYNFRDDGNLYIQGPGSEINPPIFEYTNSDSTTKDYYFTAKGDVDPYLNEAPTGEVKTFKIIKNSDS